MSGRAFYSVGILKHKIEDHLKAKAVDDNEYSILMLKDVYKQVLYLEELSKITLNTDFDDAIGMKAFELKRMLREIEDSSKSETKQDMIKNLKEEIDSFISHELKMMELECSDGLYNVSFIDDDDVGDEAVVVSQEVIGFSEVYQQLKDQLLSSWPKFTSLIGMAGIGKTALANKLFNDPTIMESFHHRVWIRVGKRYRAKDIPRLIIQEIIGRVPQGDEEAEQLKGILKSERYLIVLDDVWDRFTGLLLYPDSYGDQPFLTEESGSRILITSRLHQLDKGRDEIEEMNIKMRFLNREESWDLLRQKVFGSSSSCLTPQLEKAGIKIADKCEGLPLTILVVARLLSHHEEEDIKCNPEYWEEVATKKNHPIFVKAYDEISKVLLPSYTYLPPLLQMCFMFIGLFPPKHEIPRSRLLNLWLADGFFELNVNISSDKDVFECLDQELVSNSLVMIYQNSTFNGITKSRLAASILPCGICQRIWQKRPSLHLS